MGHAGLGSLLTVTRDWCLALHGPSRNEGSRVQKEGLEQEMLSHVSPFPTTITTTRDNVEIRR